MLGCGSSSLLPFHGCSRSSLAAFDGPLPSLCYISAYTPPRTLLSSHFSYHPPPGMFTLSRLLILGAACLPCVFGGPILDRRTLAQLQSPLLYKDRPLPPPPQQLHEIPPHLRSQSAPRINTPDFVILQFKSSGGFPGTSVALPLRRRISPCTNNLRLDRPKLTMKQTIYKSFRCIPELLAFWRHQDDHMSSHRRRARSSIG